MRAERLCYAVMGLQGALHFDVYSILRYTSTFTNLLCSALLLLFLYVFNSAAWAGCVGWNGAGVGGVLLADTTRFYEFHFLFSLLLYLSLSFIWWQKRLLSWQNLVLCMRIPNFIAAVAFAV